MSNRYMRTPELGQTVGGRPILDRLTSTELYGLAFLTRLAAQGALHSNASRLGAQLMQDAARLDQQVGERAARSIAAQREGGV